MKIPQARTNHSMCLLEKDKIVIFGGAGPYMPSVELRISYNDVQIYDTQKRCWLNVPVGDKLPKKRMSHSSGIMGGIMLVHGGYNTEGKITLDDFNLYDFTLQEWVNCTASTNGILLESQAKFGGVKC